MNELTCIKCNEIISGNNPNDVVINLASHIDNQECKSKTLIRRIQEGLPARTPNYNSHQNKQGLPTSLNSGGTLLSAKEEVVKK